MRLSAVMPSLEHAPLCYRLLNFAAYPSVPLNATPSALCPYLALLA